MKFWTKITRLHQILAEEVYTNGFLTDQWDDWLDGSGMKHPPPCNPVCSYCGPSKEPSGIATPWTVMRNSIGRWRRRAYGPSNQLCCWLQVPWLRSLQNLNRAPGLSLQIKEPNRHICVCVTRYIRGASRHAGGCLTKFLYGKKLHMLQT